LIGINQRLEGAVDLLFRKGRQGLHGPPVFALLAQALDFVEAVFASFKNTVRY